MNTFERIAKETKALILDSRPPQVFSEGFLPNSINIGLEGNFAMWVGELIPDLKQEILIVAANPEKVEETIIRLSRVGFDFAVGYLEGGFEAWKNAGKEVAIIKRITAQELEQQNHNIPIFDVRKISEFQSEHIVDAINIPLNEISNRMEDFPKDQTFILHCAGGYRSMIAASMLKQKGFDNFVDVIGGFGVIKNTKLPITNYVCPTSLL